MPTSAHALAVSVVAAILFSTSSSALAGEATIIWSRSKCELILVEKPEGEFGMVLRLSEGRVDVGNRFEDDFDSVNQIRRIKNVSSGEDIMMRGVRYSTSRK